MDDNFVRVGKEDSIVIRPIPTNYASNGRIMVISVLILFVALLIIAFFHMYTRWFLVRRSRLSLHNQRLRRADHDHHDLPLNSNSISQPHHGLGPSLLKALPTFLYSPTTHAASLECAVCLSEFQEDETGRILPNCKHSFHLDCIDMWFRTHSNCPLCRAPVQNPDGTVLIIVQIQPEETDANYSGFSPTYQRVEVVQDQVGRFHNSAVPTASPSLVQDRKIPELTIITVENPVISEAQGSSAAGGARSPVCK